MGLRATGWFDMGQIAFDPAHPDTLWAATGTAPFRAQAAHTCLWPVHWQSQARGIEELVATDIVQSPGRAPMFAALGDTPDLTPFTHVEPKIDINEHNGIKAPGAKVSRKMDFSAPDRAPMLELNEVIWKSVKGAKSEMPTPIHRYNGLALAVDADDH